PGTATAVGSAVDPGTAAAVAPTVDPTATAAVASTVDPTATTAVATTVDPGTGFGVWWSGEPRASKDRRGNGRTGPFPDTLKKQTAAQEPSFFVGVGRFIRLFVIHKLEIRWMAMKRD